MTLGQTQIELHLHLEVYVLCIGLLVAYFETIRRFGPLMVPQPGKRAVATKQKVAFVVGVAALWLASGSPLHDLAEEYLYSAHMVQHLLQAFVIPPLLLLGIPRWMGEMILRPVWLRRAVQGLSKPLIAGLLFNAVFAFIHWPAVVDTMVTSEFWHASSHILLIAASLGMWMVIVSPVPEIVPRLSPVAQMAFLFLMTLLPTIPSSFLTFGETPLYTIYETFPRVWEGFSALDDMRVAGLIMKTGGGFYLWGIIAVMFFRWAGDEERNNRPGGADAPRRAPTATTTDLPTA